MSDLPSRVEQIQARERVGRLRWLADRVQGNAMCFPDDGQLEASLDPNRPPRLIIDHMLECVEDHKGCNLVALVYTAREVADLLDQLLSHGWREIGSAPKDGTLVLLAKAGDAAWAMRCRRFENGHWRGHDSDDATHWMPLPSPPVEAK